jgi:hypothetical protein
VTAQLPAETRPASICAISDTETRVTDTTIDRAAPRSSLTECGLPGIRNIPYGTHMCHFYESREDLVSALVPYFTAGLRCNERCIWITAEPLVAADALAELRKKRINADAAVAEGSLVVRDYSEWYAEGGALKGTRVAELWLEEERRALNAGYSGLRITGNVSFLTPETWPAFMEYEALVNSSLRGHRFVTLCSYMLARCGSAEVLDVMHRHDCTIHRPDNDGWQILTGRPG